MKASRIASVRDPYVLDERDSYWVGALIRRRIRDRLWRLLLRVVAGQGL